jgi:hypothetical protein
MSITRIVANATLEKPMVPNWQTAIMSPMSLSVEPRFSEHYNRTAILPAPKG